MTEILNCDFFQQNILEQSTQIMKTFSLRFYKKDLNAHPYSLLSPFPYIRLDRYSCNHLWCWYRFPGHTRQDPKHTRLCLQCQKKTKHFDQTQCKHWSTREPKKNPWQFSSKFSSSYLNLHQDILEGVYDWQSKCIMLSMTSRNRLEKSIFQDTKVNAQDNLSVLAIKIEEHTFGNHVIFKSTSTASNRLVFKYGLEYSVLFFKCLAKPS